MAEACPSGVLSLNSVSKLNRTGISAQGSALGLKICVSLFPMARATCVIGADFDQR